MPPASPSPTLFSLPDDVLRAIVAAFDEFDLHRLARLSRAGRALVAAHRHGVVLNLPAGRRPSQQQLLAAFGLKHGALPTGMVTQRVGRSLVYDLTACLPDILRRMGGWKGVAEHLRRVAVAAAVRKRKREEGEAARAQRRARLGDWLRRVWQIPSLAEFERLVALHRLEPPAPYTSFVTSPGTRTARTAQSARPRRATGAATATARRRRAPRGRPGPARR